MLLHDLLRRLDPAIGLAELPNLNITGICEDSRLTEPGDLFIARSGGQTDGLRYLNDAWTKGAVAAIAARPVDEPPLPVAIVADPAAAGSKLAHILLGEPAEAVKVLAVTGTNGKTTTTYLIRHLLAHLNKKCGIIGTVEIDDGKSIVEATMTTPGSVQIAQLMGTMRDNGCAACAIETSSHALDQGRVAGVKFAGAAFTNLTGDHLDYHKTMENYAAAKAKLFAMLDANAAAIVNARDAWADRIVRDCRAKITRFGFEDGTDYRAMDVAITSQGSNFTLSTPGGRAEVKMGLIGRHNIENALAAAALVGEVFGLTPRQIAAGLRDAQGAPGRLQAVRSGQRFAVLVDYAHTDDALENVLSALRPLTRGKLRVIFGCGGDRDRTKRPRMARTAEKLADEIYVTSDNPRTENPQVIIGEIVSGFSADIRKRITIEADRRTAIQKAIAEAGDEDVVLLAGKGHENYQIIGAEKRHFDDVEEAEKALAGKPAK